MTEKIRTFGVPNADEYWQRREKNKDTSQRRLHRFLAEIIDRLVGAGGRVLDCGVGSGHVFALCCPRQEMYGVEMSGHAISNYEFPTDNIRQGDLNEGIPEFGVEFDAILISMVLHWLDDPEGFLKEAATRLSGRGRLIVVIPNITYYRHRIGYLFGKFPPISLSHKNFQTPREFEATVASAGCRIEKRVSPKRKIHARLWPTVFSQDLVYILKPIQVA